MHVESVTITGFRCFGPTPATILFSQGLTAIVGPNASGKTAVLQALMRLFGVTRAQRTIVPSDFHVATTEAERPKSRTLTIDERLSLFPWISRLLASPASSGSRSSTFRSATRGEGPNAPYF